ncbi:MAG: DHA2 family efflux MFS transporter permease subunit, partial [Chloroflexota bacterium]
MQTSATVDYSRKWYVMAAIAMALFVNTVDLGSIGVALPTLVRELDTDFATIQWIPIVTLLVQTTLIPLIGRLGDIIGKKPIFLIGMGGTIVGSILSGLAPNIQMLIFFRVLHAIAAAMSVALNMAIVTEAFPREERGKALGLFGLTVSTGLVIGPVLGGVIMDTLTWRWLFFASIPIALAGIFMGLKFLPDSKPQSKQPFDYWGAATFFLVILSLMMGLTLGQRFGFGSPFILGLFATFILGLGIFIFLELRNPYPVIDLSLFQVTPFTINLSMRLISFVAFRGLIFLMPFYLRDVLTFEQREVGLLITVIPVFFGILSPISGILADRFGTHPIALIGLICMAVGCFTVSTLTETTTAFGYIVRLIPFGFGLGFFQSPNNSVVMGSVPRERLGVASSLNVVTRTLGGTAGIAIMGAIWASRVSVYSGGDLPGGTTT